MLPSTDSFTNNRFHINKLINITSYVKCRVWSRFALSRCRRAMSNSSPSLAPRNDTICADSSGSFEQTGGELELRRYESSRDVPELIGCGGARPCSWRRLRQCRLSAQV